jgi:hypothetical protein
MIPTTSAIVTIKESVLDHYRLRRFLDYWVNIETLYLRCRTTHDMWRSKKVARVIVMNEHKWENTGY